MRVVLVGPVSERARLRAALTDGSLTVVGEAPTLAAARDFDTDAILIASDGRDSGDLADSVGPAYREPLTRREIEVLELLAEGLPNKAIAARLHISDQTVKFHVSSICGKLGAANRTDAVRRAVRRGIITL
jgi:DNA-binding NarL/FixJ family response regulator